MDSADLRPSPLVASQLTEVDDVVFEADCAMIVLREGNVDIGANASAEEAEEELEAGETRINNVSKLTRVMATQARLTR